MDPRKNKKSGIGKKTSLLSKNSDSQYSRSRDNASSQPRILLKAKERDEAPKKVEPTITIATKAGQQKPDQQPQQTLHQQQQPRDASKQEPLKPITVVSSMTKSVNLISAHNTLNVHAFDYLQETNSDFFVIGAIGMQATGKSTILNLLAANPCKEAFDQVLFHVGGGVFHVNSVFAQRDLGGSEDDCRMHITKDRIILLDSAPVLSNRGKKDFIVSELEDIRRIMLLLSVCHVLIVLQEDFFNINFIRLLLCAEMMIQRDQKDTKVLNPRILFIKNKCESRDFAVQEKNFNETIYKRLFKGSNLNIYNNKDDNEQVSMIHIPKLNEDKYLFTGEESYVSCVHKLRQRVFMTPTHDTIENEETLTEKSWSQIIFNVLEGYNNNYFLRKYENLKEKYNLHNHVNVVENAAKDKNYLNFVDT